MLYFIKDYLISDQCRGKFKLKLITFFYNVFSQHPEFESKQMMLEVIMFMICTHCFHSEELLLHSNIMAGANETELKEVCIKGLIFHVCFIHRFFIHDF